MVDPDHVACYRMHELVAVYEFGPGDTEEVILYEGSEQHVHRIAVELERETALGLAGIRYDGDRLPERPLQVVLVERKKETP